ncbi:MAG: type II secretion system F family protein [Deltaproteobacteria bacterium]|nr:type II secretion system F family protein [Deltaproteobacteria bacterium]
MMSWYARWRQRCRQQRAQAQLPMALHLLGSALQAGDTLSQAMAVVALEAPWPLREGFQDWVREEALGVPLASRLERLAERIGGRDLLLIRFTLLLLHDAGGNLVAACDRWIAAIDARVRLRDKVHLATIQGRISGGLIAMIPLGLLGAMALWMPAFVQPLVTTWPGRVAGIGGVLLNACGLWWMLRWSRVDV